MVPDSPDNANVKRQLSEPNNAVFQSDNVFADFPERIFTIGNNRK
jgi:hypothetical protein